MPDRKAYFRKGEHVAYAQGSELQTGRIERFERAPDGVLIVITQDRYLNHPGRPILRRPEQVLSIE